jgi:hopanoid biosynthesis associated protein HpnK
VKGILTAASLMVGAAAATDAVARARRLPSLRVGLHLVLVDGTPVLPLERIPDLVDGSGRLRRDLGRTGIEMFISPGARRQLAAEIEAQFAAFHRTGLKLDHVNAHHHYHLHPTVCRYVLDIGARYGMTALRVPGERADLVDRFDPGVRRGRDWLAPWTSRLRRAARRYRLTTPDQVFGQAWSGAMTEERIAQVLRNLPAGLTEIYCHPAMRDEFTGAARGYRYAEELAALVAPRIRELMMSCPTRRGGFSDFAMS